MGKWPTILLYVMVMVVVIVGVDIAFFKNNFSGRLMSNIGLVAVFLGVYLKFVGRPWSPRN